LWHGRGYDRWFAAFSFGFFWFGLGGAFTTPAVSGMVRFTVFSSEITMNL
jgi:hypothetical protein